MSDMACILKTQHWAQWDRSADKVGFCLMTCLVPGDNMVEGENYLLIIVLFQRFTICCPGSPGTCCVNQALLELRDSSASLKAFTTCPGRTNFSKLFSDLHTWDWLCDAVRMHRSTPTPTPTHPHTF